MHHRAPHYSPIPLWSSGPVIQDGGLAGRTAACQEELYDILHLQQLLHRAKTIETLTASIVWCTVWHDARERLRGMEVDTRTVVKCGRDRTAVGHGPAPMHRFTTQGEEHG